MSDMHQFALPAPAQCWGMFIVKAPPAPEHIRWAAHYAATWNECGEMSATQAWDLVRTPPLGSSSFLIHGETVLFSAVTAPKKGDFVVVVTDHHQPSFKVHKVTK